MDQVFLFTLLAIFGAALFGTYFNRRTRDRCLKDFRGFHTTALLRDGKAVWGLLEVYPSGIELLYPTPHRDREGHLETSTILVQEQLAQIQAVHRYHDELTPERQEQRLLEIERASRPSATRRLVRRLRNFLNTFRDAFQQSLGFSLSRFKASTGAALLQQDAHLNQLGQSVLSVAASAYEPVLERYLNRRVVVEERQGQRWIERAGVLKEYTSQWIEIVDVRIAEQQRLDLAAPERLRLLRDLDFVVRLEQSRDSKSGVRLALEIANLGAKTVHLLGLEADGYSHRLDLELAAGSRRSLAIDDLPPELVADVSCEALPCEISLLRESVEADQRPDAIGQPNLLPEVELVIQAEREVDLCLPRTHALLRHGGG